MGMTAGSAAARIALVAAALVPSAASFAQDHAVPARGPAETRNDLFLTEPPLGAGPWEFQTAQERIRVSVVARGLEWPWSLAILPDGNMLVTERVGRLRVVRDGTLDPQPIAGVPAVSVGLQSGLYDVVLHPGFEDNRLVYLSYAKPLEAENAKTLAVARGRLEGSALVDVEDIFVSNVRIDLDSRFGGSSQGARMAFDRDGYLFVTSGDPTFGYGNDAQVTSDHGGTVLRLNDDGSVPADNPFVGEPGFAPEIYSYGHRNPQGLAIHPVTNVPWVSEHGPQGGDELNVLVAGGNYGWPLLSHGRDYDGVPIGDGEATGEGFEAPLVHWSPAIGPSGLEFYTGEAFPAWVGSAFIGAMGRVAAGHLERQAFTDAGPIGGEVILGTLQQRIRDVRQSPEGLLYLLTEYEDGALLRIEPAPDSTPARQVPAPPAYDTTGADLQAEAPMLGDGPWEFETAQQRIRVTAVARGLSRPFGMAFLPTGDALVAELPGRLRLVHDGELDPRPIAGVPEVHAVQASGLKDVAVHPDFAENRWIYLAYIKPGADGASTTAVARARLEDHALVDVRDILIADASTDRDADSGARLAFDRDGFLFVTIGDRFQVDRVQNMDNHFGKVLRLRDDGSVPDDNPFVGSPGSAPGIYTLGHRNPQGLAVDPWTGDVWANEHGPQGGDELNRLVAGANYGWPLATYGRDYDGSEMTDTPVRDGTERPVLFWVPAVAPSGLTFYTGNAFPSWRGNIFMGAMGRQARGHLRRIVFDANGREVGQEVLLDQLRQRIRDVREAPDGLLYVLTDHEPGALLRIEPAP